MEHTHPESHGALSEVHSHDWDGTDDHTHDDLLGPARPPYSPEDIDDNDYRRLEGL